MAALKQPLAVVGVAGEYHLEAGDVHEQRVRPVGVVGRHAAAVVHGGAVDDGQVDLSAEHIAHLGRLADELVHAYPHEAGQALDDGAHPHCCRAHGCAEEGVFRQGAVTHPLAAELLEQPARRAVDALLDVFAHDEDALIKAHLLPHRLVDGLGVGDVAGLRFCDHFGISLAICHFSTQRAQRIRRVRRDAPEMQILRAFCVILCVLRVEKPYSNGIGSANISSQTSSGSG